MDYIKEITIGDIKLKNNVFLAPMAGITDIAFRKICRKFGPSITFTEMASTKALEYNSEKTKKLIKIDEKETPSAIQIFGSNVDTIKNTIEKINEMDNVDIVDINMGCPAPKLVKNGDGAGLLKNLEMVKKIVEVASKSTNKILTVKTRKGFDSSEVTAIKVAKICEEYGVKMITIHGRTREQYYSGVADQDIIRQVKESVNIPVIGNGDIVDFESAKNMFEKTKVDGIMIARGALGNPWIFKSILEQKEYIPTIAERFSVIFEHIEEQLKIDDEKNANFKMRKHIAWYIKGLKNSAEIKNKINTSESIENTIKILNGYKKYLEETK